MSASDFSGRLLAPVIALPRRPLSSSESTASWSMRFSLRTMISGALSSSRRFRRLLRLITRRYRSFRSEVAKRPPSSGTSGRRSGGSTGSTSMIIQSGLMPGLVERLEHLQALGDLLDLGLGAGGGELVAQLVDVAADVELPQQVADALGAHGRREVVAVLLDLGEVVVLGEQLAAVQRRHARVGHDVGFEIQHALDVAQRHVEHHAQARGQALQEPDVRDGLASSMWPMRSRRTLASVTSTPHFSQITPRCFRRLYLPHRHS